MKFKTNEELVTYIRSLQPGERVIETERSCLYKREGVVYMSEYKGEPTICVLWDKYEGEDGQMGTSVTGGTRRIRDVKW